MNFSNFYKKCFSNTKFKFILVGIWNTIFGYLVFVAFETLFSLFLSPRYLAYMSAMILGQFIAVINAYIFHKFITFKSSVKGKAIIAEFFRFFMTYLATFLISLFLLPIFVEILKISPKIAGAYITVLVACTSYLGHSKFTFRKV